MHVRWSRAGSALLLGLVSLLAGCDDHLVGKGVPIANTCTRQPPLRYENVGEGLVQRHCRSCHGRYQVGANRANAPVGIDFDDEADVLRFANAIYREVAIDQTMPPAGGMLQVERELMGEWLRCDILPRAGTVNPDSAEEE